MVNFKIILSVDGGKILPTVDAEILQSISTQALRNSSQASGSIKELSANFSEIKDIPLDRSECC